MNSRLRVTIQHDSDAIQIIHAKHREKTKPRIPCSRLENLFRTPRRLTLGCAVMAPPFQSSIIPYVLGVSFKEHGASRIPCVEMAVRSHLFLNDSIAKTVQNVVAYIFLLNLIKAQSFSFKLAYLVNIDWLKQLTKYFIMLSTVFFGGDMKSKLRINRPSRAFLHFPSISYDTFYLQGHSLCSLLWVPLLRWRLISVAVSSLLYLGAVGQQAKQI